MTGLILVAAILAAATVFGLWFARSSGRIKDTGKGPGPIQAAREGDPPVDIEPTPTHEGDEALRSALAGRAGSRATVVQFSSAFCQPCRATRRILEEVAVMVPGVAHVEIDAEDNLELVRAVGIRRTPTVLFVDQYGVVRKRASGLPRKADVIAALGELIPG